MDKFVVILLLLILACQAESVKFTLTDSYHLLLDCGVNSKFTQPYKDQLWFADSSYIDSGKTKQINSTDSQSLDVPQFFTTLRYFPKDDLNCYGLGLTDKFKYIFRAGFYYANYDGKSLPPVFDLLLGGQLWEIVNSSSSNVPMFHEVVYRPKDGNITVCLRGRNDGGTPFISSLEATYLKPFDYGNQTSYSKMKNGTAYHLVTRINFGGYQQVIAPWSIDLGEEQNRYWMPQEVPGYENLSFDDITLWWSDYENSPPPPVLATAIASQNTSRSIHTSITLPKSNPQSTYIVLYFYQDFNASQNLNVTRYMDIYVDGLMRANVKFDTYRACEVVTLYPILTQDVTNITISAANGTILPPLLNGLEVFIATELDEQSSYANKKSSCFVVWILHFFVIVFIV